MFSGIDFTFLYTDFLQLGLTEFDWRILLLSLFVVVIVDILHVIYKEQLMNMFLQENLCVRYIIFIGLFVSTVVFGIYGAGYDAATFIYRGF